MSLLRFTTLVFSLALSLSLARAADGVRLAAEPGQTFLGWGVEVSDELTYDPVIGHNFPKKHIIFSELRPDFVTLAVHNDWYDNGRDDGGVFLENLRYGLFPKLQMLTDAGLGTYVTYVDGIPEALTRRGQANSFDREIAPERKEDYAKFLVAMFQAVQAENLPLPVAHSLQVPFAQSRQRAAGTGPYADDWREDGKRLATQFKGVFDTNLKIIGPDAQTPAWTVARILGPKATSLPENMAGLLPEGFGLGFGNYGLTRPDTRSMELLRGITNAADRQGTEIWMTGWLPMTAKGERETALAAARRIAGDVGRLRVNYWCWGSGYTAGHSATTLVWGDGEKTVLFGLFKRLWGKVRPGFTVRTVAFDDAELAAEGPFGEGNGIAFESGNRIILLLVNPGTTEKTCALAVPQVKDAVAFAYADSAEGVETAPVITAGAVTLVLPAQSASVVELTR
jgi:hypothetical protein